MNRLFVQVGMLIVSCFATVGALQAAEVYRWVDAEGVVHFSDTRPEELEDVDTLQVLEHNPPDYDPADDPYNILNQAERTGETLSRIEKDQAERAERAEQREQAQEAYMAEPTRQSPYLYGTRTPIFRPPFYPPQLPPHRPTPRPSYRQQYSALEENGLNGRRPSSINSGEHAARVQRSQSLPLSVGPGPRPRPR